jgi:hypothetical protein
VATADAPDLPIGVLNSRLAIGQSERVLEVEFAGWYWDNAGPNPSCQMGTTPRMTADPRALIAAARRSTVSHPFVMMGT